MEYDLTISVIAGGSVTEPGEGTFTYDTGTVVSLNATAEGLVPSQFAGAYKGLPYGSFRHVNRLLINVLQVFLHID